MKSLLILLTGTLTGLNCLGQVQQAWVNRYSLNPSLTNQAASMLLTAEGNVVVAGSSASTNGDLDYLVIKYAASGGQIWLSRYDSPTNAQDQLRGMSQDAGANIFVTGTTKTLKLNSSGNVLWAAPYGGRAVATDQGSNAYVTGFSDLDYATVKLNPNGTNLWVRTFTYYTSTNLPDISSLVATGSNGIVAVCGFETHFLYLPSGYTERWTTTICYDTSGTQLWIANTTNHENFAFQQPVAMAVDQAGRVLVADNMGNDDAYQTTLYDQGGNILWNWFLDIDAVMGYSGFGTGMALDTVGNVYRTGWRQNGDVCLTLKLTNGHKAWISTYHGAASGANQGNAIALDAAGNIYVAAYSPGTNSGNDIVTIKYDNNGNQLWVQRYDGPAPGDDIPTAIAVDNQGGVYVTGYSATTNGGTEFVTIKYAEQNVKRNNDGSIQLTFFTTPGQTSAFYGSTDFLTWSNLGNAVADTNGVVQFTDTNAPLFQYRFYKRSILP